MSTSTPNRTTNGADSSRAFAGLPEASAQQVQGFLSKPGRLLIDGEWVEAASGKTFETFNPATEERLGWVAHGETEDVELAVAAARPVEPPVQALLELAEEDLAPRRSALAIRGLVRPIPECGRDGASLVRS